MKKDKKNRFYIVSALADTKVDLKGMHNFVNVEFLHLPVLARVLMKLLCCFEAEQCYLSGLVWEKVV